MKEIQLIGGSWHFTPGTCNPADIPTRGSSVASLPSSWWHGPEWLPFKSEWPQEPEMDRQSFDETLLELRKSAHAAVVQVEGSPFIVEFVEPSTSRWKVLVGSAIRIIRLFRGPVENIISVAVQKILRETQRAAFANEHELFLHAEEEPVVLPRNSRIRELKPFMDESGLLRVGGRLDTAHSLDFEAKHPIILDRVRSVELLVLDVHRELSHSGTSATLVECRKRGFWLLRGREVDWSYYSIMSNLS